MLNFLLNTFVKTHYDTSLFNRQLLIVRDSNLKNKLCEVVFLLAK